MSTADGASPEGLEATADDPAALRQALDLAFDYRGDVTIVRRSAPDPLRCFVFDRRTGAGGAEVRVIAADDGARHEIAASDIDRIVFSGRDTAAGRSFETWMKKYVQRKLAGQAANIESEPLPEDS